MTRRSMLLRSMMLVFALFSATMFCTNVASAQYDCKCDYGTIYVSDDVDCKFDVCIKTISNFECITVGPGSVEKFKCDQIAAIYLVDCKGNYVEITEDCVKCVCVGDKCYVDACLGRDSDGCLYVKIAKSGC